MKKCPDCSRWNENDSDICKYCNKSFIENFDKDNIEKDNDGTFWYEKHMVFLLSCLGMIIGYIILLIIYPNVRVLILAVIVYFLIYKTHHNIKKISIYKYIFRGIAVFLTTAFILYGLDALYLIITGYGKSFFNYPYYNVVPLIRSALFPGIGFVFGSLSANYILNRKLNKKLNMDSKIKPTFYCKEKISAVHSAKGLEHQTDDEENEDSSIKEQKDFAIKNTSQTKKCPYCAEVIQREAIKCKHCKSELEKIGNNSNDASDSVGQKEALKLENRKFDLSVLLLIIKIIVVLFIIMLGAEIYKSGGLGTISLRLEAQSKIVNALKTEYSMLQSTDYKVAINGVSVNGTSGVVNATVCAENSVNYNLNNLCETNNFYFTKYDTGWQIRAYE